jgi:hypothetical protein
MTAQRMTNGHYPSLTVNYPSLSLELLVNLVFVVIQILVEGFFGEQQGHESQHKRE